MRRSFWIVLALLVLGLWLWSQQRVPAPIAPAGVPGSVSVPPPSRPDPSPAATRGAPDTEAETPDYPAVLPSEAHDVLRRIAQGGPFEYRQDGSVFQNRERRLPQQPRGYYHEYTVETPGSRDRGARRIITGGEPPREYWYTDDHYRSFQRFEVSR